MADPGSLVVRVVDVGDTSGYVECAARAHNLAVTGVARDKCSPFLVVSRYCNMAGTWEVIHRSTKATTSELDPLWPRFEASLHRVCANDRETYLRIEVWNDEANGQHLLLGQAETSVAGILAHPFNGGNTADSSGGVVGRGVEHGKVHLELSTGSTGQPALHVQPKRSKQGLMRLPPSKAVVTVEMIVRFSLCVCVCVCVSLCLCLGVSMPDVYISGSRYGPGRGRRTMEISMPL